MLRKSKTVTSNARIDPSVAGRCFSSITLAHSLYALSHIPACVIRVNPDQLEGVHYMHHYRCRIESLLSDPGSSVFIFPPIK